jgi:hypothetical protein
MSRIVWGTTVLTSVLEGWLTQIERSKTFYTLVLVRSPSIIYLPVVCRWPSLGLNSLLSRRLLSLLLLLFCVC